MLALSNPDPALAFPPGTSLRPQLFIRNSTSKPVDAALRFNWRADGASGKAAGPALRLNPYETRRIDVAALQNSGLLPKQANWTSVTLTTNGLPDEVMAVAASYDDTLRYGAQTPFSDQLSFQWEGGMWEYDAYHSSIITAGNGGTKPARAAFTIFYNQGTEKYELEQTLQPDEQMWIDVGKLIREHVPDKNGKTLSPDITSGSYEIRDLTDIGAVSLFEGKVIFDKTYGHAAYGCANCCDFTNVALDANPLSIPFQGASQNGMGAYQWCADHYTDVSSYFLNGWKTGNTGITTVNYMGTYSGVGVGSTTDGACGYIPTGQQRNCPAFLLCRSGTAKVQVPVPTKVLPIATRSQGVIICSNGQGWNRIVTNQLQDQFGRGYLHAGIVMADILSFGTNQLGLSPETGSATTDPNGSWADFYADCTSACPSSGQSNALQTWTYNGIPLAHANTVIYKCTSITIDGF